LIYIADWRDYRNGFGRVGFGWQSTMDRRTCWEWPVNWRGLCFTGRRNRRSVHRFLRMHRCVAGSQMYAPDSEYQRSIFELGECINKHHDFISFGNWTTNLILEENFRREIYLKLIKRWHLIIFLKFVKLLKLIKIKNID